MVFWLRTSCFVLWTCALMAAAGAQTALPASESASGASVPGGTAFVAASASRPGVSNAETSEAAGGGQRERREASRNWAERSLATVLRLFDIDWLREDDVPRAQRAQVVVSALSSIVLFCSLVLTFVSLIVALFVALLNRTNAQVDVFIKMRTAFSAVRTQLAEKNLWNIETVPTDPAQMQCLQRYWFQSFDEWYITQKLHRFTLGKLWHSYYKAAIFHAHKNPALRQALVLAEHDSENPIDAEFVAVVRALRGVPVKRAVPIAIPPPPPPAAT